MKFATKLLPFLLLGLTLSARVLGQTVCPTISIETPPKILRIGEPAAFRASLSSPGMSDGMSFTWGSSSGEIKNGWKSTMELTPRATDGGINIHVFLKVDGLPKGCEQFAEETVSVQQVLREPFGEEFSSFYLEEIMARIDNFFIHIQNNPGSTGFVVIYFDSKQTRAQRLSLINKFLTAIRFRKYDIEKIEFAFIEPNDKWGTRGVLGLLPLGVDRKETRLPSDTVFVKGKDVMANPNKALPKTKCTCVWK